MIDSPHRIDQLKWWIFLVCLPVIAGAVQIDLPSYWGGFIGDSAVYYGMADSLANDGDLRYTREDLVRLTREWPGGPQGVLLTADRDNPEVIHYAKPMLYSLAAAPLVKLFQANGLLLFNALCFAFLVFLGCMAFPEMETKRPFEIVIWSLIFFGLTAVPGYIFNLTPDLFNGTLLMAGLVPWIRHKTSQRPTLLLMLSTALLGLAAASRQPNAVFIGLPLWSLIFSRSWKAPGRVIMKRLVLIVVVVALFIGALAAVYGASYLLTGQGFAYSGFRKRVVDHFPFESEHHNFMNTGNMMSTESTKFIFHWDTLINNVRYFFIGRFAGLIPYFFPAFIGLLLLITSKDKSAIRWPIVFAVVVLYFFHLIYIPSNWHGGSCAIGNRYLISWLPALFVLTGRPPNKRLLLVTATITALLTGTVAMSPASAFLNYREIPKREIMQIFPMEISLLESWPVDDLRHRRVDYDDYFLYFADDNQFGQEQDGYWVRGQSRADCVMRCWKPAEKVVLKLRNGGRPGVLSGFVGNASFKRPVRAGEFIRIELEPGNPEKAYNLAGNVSYCYPVGIEATSGFIPRYSEPGSSDHRFLGCFVQIELGS